MAICYSCGEEFKDVCSNCGWIPTYKCWCCKTSIDIEETHECSSCGWFVCIACESCGCDSNRPLSKLEKRREEGW